MRRALLVGGTGFAGRHLAARLAGDWTVVASGREADVRDPAAMRALVAETRPDAVVDLAALTTVQETRADPTAAHEVAVGGLRNLLEALAAARFGGRLLQVSSSEVYGHPGPEALPLTEASPPDPQSPYAEAKLAAEQLCADWSGRMDIVTARPFTHLGPGQSPRFAAASWARQLGEIRIGARPPVLRTGALDATRDLTDVRDVADAYAALLAQGQAGATYNICSGVETPMRAVLEALVAAAGVEVRLETDPALVRGAEQKRLRGDASALRRDTGWRPKIALSKTLSDMLQDAQTRLRGETA